MDEAKRDHVPAVQHLEDHILTEAARKLAYPSSNLHGLGIELHSII